MIETTPWMQDGQVAANEVMADFQRMFGENREQFWSASCQRYLTLGFVGLRLLARPMALDPNVFQDRDALAVLAREIKDPTWQREHEEWWKNLDVEVRTKILSGISNYIVSRSPSQS